MKPKLLDLFCGAGGAAKGYQQAGFYVVGVDINPQPHYCGDEFHRADALTFPLDGFDAIHASPPCQAYSDLAHLTKRTYPTLIEPTRNRLIAAGLPYVIENVEGAPLNNPITLCGTMFPPLRVIRHRLFESNVPLVAPSHPPGRHPLCFTYDKRKSHFGKLDPYTAFITVTGGGNGPTDASRNAMGISWMGKGELNEAIPPAYTEWVGRQIPRLQYVQLGLALGVAAE